MSLTEGPLRVTKLLSNNASVVVDGSGAERVVIGKGVAFGLRPGDLVDPSAVEKDFRLSLDSVNSKFQEVLSALSLEEIHAVERIVREVKSTLGRPVSDALYVSLADHIHFSLANYAQGIVVPNGLLLDVRRFYPDEYRLGAQALGIIYEETGVSLPSDEAGFVALHIVNAEMGNAESTQRAVQATRIIEGVLDIVRRFFGVDIAEDSLAHYRFVTHLRFFSQRLLEGSTFSGSAVDRDLLRSVSKKYPDSYGCALAIRDLIQDKFGVDIGWEELLYLTIHIQHAINTER